MKRFPLLVVVGSGLLTAASVLAALAIVASWAGCTATTVGEAQAPIIGGTDDTADPSVVVLFAQVPGQQGGSLCTAEVISPHVVLTAAHCVSPAEVGTGAQFVVYVGSNFDNATQADLLTVTETHFDPQFSTQNLEGGHDVGVAILAKPAPVAALAVNRTALDAALVGKPVRFVGFGLDNSQAQTGAGVKRQTTTTLSDYNALLIHFTDGLHETCNGDSGGPAFMTLGGKEVIVGLTSYGDVNCNQGGYDSRVDALLSFVDPYVAKLDPAPATAPDLGHPELPDMATPPRPSTPPTGSVPTTPSTPPSSTPSSPPSSSSPSTPPSSSSPSTPSTPSTGREVGAACRSDSDCASHVCGLGTQGTLVCVAGNAESGGFGCSISGVGDETSLALLITMALLLARSLRQRKRR